jgi:hypothetical protein
MQNSIYELGKSVYGNVATAYSRATRREGPLPEAAPEEPTRAPPDAPARPMDKWDAAQVFAQKAGETSDLEHEFVLVYERRRTTAMELSDCVRRREEPMLDPLAKEWLRSEQKLLALGQRYAAAIAHREQTLKACNLGADDNA